MSTPMITKNPIPSMLSLLKNPWVINPGNDTTIPENIIRDIPLPMPRSVISSPSHTRNIVPAVMDSIAAMVGNMLAPLRPTFANTLLC